jgi:hypothetical protein
MNGALAVFSTAVTSLSPKSGRLGSDIERINPVWPLAKGVYRRACKIVATSRRAADGGGFAACQWRRLHTKRNVTGRD